MPQKRILPYVIMGILLNKDCTGKQIMDEFRFDIGEFWQSSHSQVYPELKRMEQDHWIESYSKEDNDKEIHYRLTAYGYEIINDWLMEPVDKLPVSKDLFSLKTFFINDRNDPRLEKLFRHQIQLVSNSLNHLRERRQALFSSQKQIDQHYGHYLILARAISRQENQLAWLEDKLNNR